MATTAIKSGFIQWKLDQNDMQTFLNAQNGECMFSNSINIDQLQFNLYVYPNGTDNSRIGHVDLYLSMKSPSASSATISYELCCIETSIRYINCVTLSSGDSTGWVFKLMKLKNCRNKLRLHFECNIDILRILHKTQNNCNGISSYHKYTEIPIYNQIKWSLAGNIFEKFKKQIHPSIVWSNKFGNKCWILYAYPNGDFLTNKGYIILGIKLLQKPHQISKLYVDYNISCNQSPTISKGIKMIKYNNQNNYILSFPDIKLQSTILSSLSSISFEVKIKIHEVYDYDNMKIPQNKWNEYGIIEETKEQEHMALMEKSIKMLQTELEKLEIENKELKKKINAMEVYVYNNNDDQKDNALQSSNITLDLLLLKKQFKDMQQQINVINTNNNHNNLQTKEEQLKLYLKNIGMETYLDILIGNGFDDIDSMKDLDDNTMQDIGIKKVGHRKKLLRYMREINNNLSLYEGNTSFVM